RRHTRCLSDWSSDVCSSDLILTGCPQDDNKFEASRQHARRLLLVESGSRGDGEFGGHPFGGRLAGARNGLAAANPNFNCAGDDAANAFVVDGTQFAVMKSERDGLRTGGSEVNALEPGQRADRCAVNARMREIDLDNFVACN